ncbi:LA_2272 family surface repeat-containing protein [Bacteroides propionicifaciens]|uniref:LA_2272 family surface repeat-containing protein n=1 Tax=Bacteroides propionicifaciens TaxID=392838 RepID=UPI0003653BEB|nr:hypothetical protein [Bacteroides propionicifaciens]
MRHNLLRFITTAALTLAAVVVLGQNKSAGINLSLWNKVSTQPINPAQKTYFNLGIVSAQNKLRGFSLNLLSNQVDGDAYGVQLVGLANVVGEKSTGLQVAGVANVIGEYSNGVTIAGLGNMVGESQHGVSLAGLINLIGIDSKGLSVAGLGNAIGYNSIGVAVGGVFNIIGDNMIGLGLAGLLNITDNTYGLSASGLINIAQNTSGLSFAPFNINSNNFYGLQAGLANINTNRFYGLQLGLLNVGIVHKGLQLGLVNYYNESLTGFQLGLINLNPDTKVSILAYGGNRTKLNIAARFKNRLFYNIIGVGSPYLKFSDKFSGTINYRAGIYLPLAKNLEISGDLGYQHINTFSNKNKEEGIAKRMYGLQARINLEYLFTPKWSIIATGGYETTRWYSKSKTYHKGALVEGGIAYTI